MRRLERQGAGGCRGQLKLDEHEVLPEANRQCQWALARQKIMNLHKT